MCQQSVASLHIEHTWTNIYLQFVPLPFWGNISPVHCQMLHCAHQLHANVLHFCCLVLVRSGQSWWFIRTNPLNWMIAKWWGSWMIILPAFIITHYLISVSWTFMWLSKYLREMNVLGVGAQFCSKHDPVQRIWDVADFHALSAQPTIASALSPTSEVLLWGKFKRQKPHHHHHHHHPCSAWIPPPLTMLLSLSLLMPSSILELPLFFPFSCKVPADTALGLAPGQLLSKSLSQSAGLVGQRRIPHSPEPVVPALPSGSSTLSPDVYLKQNLKGQMQAFCMEI